MKQILHPDRAPGDLIFVRRANATTGCPNLAGSFGCLARSIECHVMRQNQGTGFADRQSAADIDAGSFQRAYFF
jgi:hypothetical protein